METAGGEAPPFIGSETGSENVKVVKMNEASLVVRTEMRNFAPS